MHLHLDPLGGIAGDMFVAAMLDGFPHLEAGMLHVLGGLPALVGLTHRSVSHNDGVLLGRRFLTGAEAPVSDSAVLENTVMAHENQNAQSHTHSHAYAHYPHGHVRWADLRRDLESSGLNPAVLCHALAIFTLLANAEGKVHGVASEDVCFHEVGAADSLADIVGAAYLITHCGAADWSVSALPLGSGRVRTAHGVLPVPAPAAALLMEGFKVFNDGLSGERVTPTGAAILRHLMRPEVPGYKARSIESQTLVRSGFGFGAKVFPGLSNCLRVLVFEKPTPDQTGPGSAKLAAVRPVSATHTLGVPHREIAVIEFEVDDQTAEDLSVGLDRLREAPGIHDVVQMSVFGKKGRIMTHVRVLAAPAALDNVVTACFRETTTIGLRHQIVSGASLPRVMEEIVTEGTTVRVKVVERPGAVRTAKADISDLPYALEGSQARRNVRSRAEAEALSRVSERKL